jgi:BirA family transcriptional regulator, biotin operon repressor / biotin---[acetyl-CoA-carboxylase] ligase
MSTRPAAADPASAAAADPASGAADRSPARPAAADPDPVAADRAPLCVAALHGLLVRPAAFWRDVRVVAQTGSSNTDLLAAARDGAPEGVVLAAESQTAGRGRLGRRWVSPPRAALTFSVLLRPRGVPAGSKGWVPLLAGVAVATALRAETGLDARLKWPNDVLLGGAKVAGILAEQSGDAIVIGAGINVSGRQDELPAAGATSLAMAGAARIDREHLLVGVLAELERWYLAWLGTAGPCTEPAAGPEFAGPDADACGLRAEYRRLSGTMGAQVSVSLPGGEVLTGTAQDVDDAGRLVVLAASGLVAVSAGDVVHLR